MPNRILRDWTDSPAVNLLSDAAEKFFCRLIQKADDFGRFHGSVQMLRPMLYPLQLDRAREADIQRLIAECVKAGLVRFYEAEGKSVLEICKFGQAIRAQKSKFPDSKTGNATQVHSKCIAAAPVFVDVFVDGDVGVVGEPAPEVCSEDEAVTMTMTAGIPEAFVRYVHQDWASRQGKDAGGVLVRFLGYVAKRWAREQVEWKAKTHKGFKSSAGHDQKPSNAPSKSDVIAYSKEKWGDDHRYMNWAVSFHAFWSDKARNWRKLGKVIDWRVELQGQVSKWRTEK